MQECLTTLWRENPVEVLRKTEKIKSITFVPYMRKNTWFKSTAVCALSRPKSHYRFFLLTISILRRLFWVSAIQLDCALQCQGQGPYVNFCLELPYLKAKHLLKAFWYTHVCCGDKGFVWFSYLHHYYWVIKLLYDSLLPLTHEVWFFFLASAPVYLPLLKLLYYLARNNNHFFSFLFNV